MTSDISTSWKFLYSRSEGIFLPLPPSEDTSRGGIRRIAHAYPLVKNETGSANVVVTRTIAIAFPECDGPTAKMGISCCTEISFVECRTQFLERAMTCVPPKRTLQTLNLNGTDDSSPLTAPDTEATPTVNPDEVSDRCCCACVDVCKDVHFVTVLSYGICFYNLFLFFAWLSRVHIYILASVVVFFLYLCRSTTL